MRRTIDLILVQKPGDRSNIDRDFVITEKPKEYKSKGAKSNAPKSRDSKSRGGGKSNPQIVLSYNFVRFQQAFS